MALRPEDEKRIKRLVGSIYADGFSSGVEQAATRFELEGAIPDAGASMPKSLKVRLDLVDQAVQSYVERLEAKAAEFRAQGVTGPQLAAEVHRYATELARDKGQLISEMEFAQARMDGAGAIVNESGEEFEWRFPHFDLATPGHEECPICQAIRDGGPYSSDEAEAEGFPTVPHPNCDHGWVLVPKGELTRTEEHPQPNLP